MKAKKLFAVVALLTVTLVFTGSFAAAAGDSKADLKLGIGEATELLKTKLITTPGFVGISRSGDTINVYVVNEESGSNLPNDYRGHPVRKIVTGEITAVGLAAAPAIPELQQYQIHTGRIRPLVGGISISSYDKLGVGRIRLILENAGTLGMITYDDKILSNAHVIALNSLTGRFHKPGHPIVQPGTLDGGTIDNDKIGELEAYVPITFSNRNKPNPTVNHVDAAIGTLQANLSWTSGAQYDGASGYMISGVTEVEVGDMVEKSGRTTGVTNNTVVDTNAQIWVRYPRYFGLSSQYAWFEDVIMITSNLTQPFSRPGDSGSAVHKDGEFVGLNFAGSSDQNSGTAFSFICKAEHIIDALGVSVERPQQLYAGGSNPGVVYRYLGGTEWETISPDFGFAVLSLVEYDDHLYAGTTSAQFGGVGQVYRYDGGSDWTLIGDGMDSQVSSLAVYQGNLYAGTSLGGAMKLYKYNDSPHDWDLVVNYMPWYGTRSLHVFNDYLLMGDWAFDYFGHWDGASFYADHQGGGSCIYDYADYGGYVYASAYYGRLWQSSNGIDWSLVLTYDYAHGHMWELEVFGDELYMGYSGGQLRASNLPNPNRGTLIYMASDEIISMGTDNSKLYFGTGGEAGYRHETSGIANVYQYDGTTTVSISGDDEMGAGVQVLYVTN